VAESESVAAEISFYPLGSVSPTVLIMEVRRRSRYIIDSVYYQVLRH